MKLKKYKLIHLDKDQKWIISSNVPGGKIHVSQITDQIAEKLHEKGSRYVAKVKEPVKKAE
jgi:hypothetical protein